VLNAKSRNVDRKAPAGPVEHCARQRRATRGGDAFALVDELLLPQAASTAQAPSAASAPPTLLCDGKRYLMFM